MDVYWQGEPVTQLELRNIGPLHSQLSILRHQWLFQGPRKKYGRLRPNHGSGVSPSTTPFLILSSPFLPFTHHFSSGKPGWRKASPAQHNFPRPGTLGRWEPRAEASA